MSAIASPLYHPSTGITLTLFERRPAAYAEGGLASLAEYVRGGGRGDDEVLLHISPEEFEWLRNQWGEPDINPITGLPEYGWLSKAWKKVKKAVKKVVKSPIFQALAPILLNFVVPGAGALLGGALGATGTAASVIGNGLIGAGIGAAGGGTKGAIAGALTGGMAGGGGSALGSALGASGRAAPILGNAILGGAASSAQGGDFARGALLAGGTTALAPYASEALSGTRFEEPANRMFGMGEEVGASDGVDYVVPTGDKLYRMDTAGPIKGSEITAASVGATSPLTQAAAASGSGSGILSKAGQYIKDNPLPSALMAGTLLNAASQRRAGAGEEPQLPEEFYQELPNATFDRRSVINPEDFYTYGQARPEHQFFANNVLPTVERQAHGGSIRREHLVRGKGTGRSDEILAQLSDGEYVMDAETVALLGDGSTDAGARRLDEMRRNLRQHKGSKLSKGKFSHKAKSPEQYMGAR